MIYLPFVGSGDVEKDRKALENEVNLKEDELEAGERYAIVGMSFVLLLISNPIVPLETY